MKIKKVTPAQDGLDKSAAMAVFEHVERFASYGFNKSHAAAYASISFQTASLKARHPHAFYAASMNMSIGTVEDLAMFAGELKSRQIPLLRPDVNRSQARFVPHSHNDAIAVDYGLAAIRGVGHKAGQAIEQERNANGPFTSLDDFRTRMGNTVNKRALTHLIKAGALDDLVITRRDGVDLIQDKKDTTSNQMSFFDTAGVDTRETLEEYDLATLMDNEFTVFGFWHWTHPLTGQGRALKAAGLSSLRALKQKADTPKTAWLVAGVVDTDMRGTKSGGVMGIVKLSDSLDVYEAVAFDDTWSQIRSVCRKKETVALQVNVVNDDGIFRLLIQKAVPLSDRLKKAA